MYFLMKKTIFLIALTLLLGKTSFAQVGINSDNSTPDPSAMIDIKSTNKGALLPRMTQAQISAISNPANGLQVFCTTNSKMYIYIAPLGCWKEVAYGTGIISPLTFSCGTPITINHFAGDVAPIDKTVTYGTVTNIPGETSKCWISSNLGSSHQAISVDDAYEASAGWYWQFNLKQGYMHDGSTRTPNTPWISSISENSDWITANDPCNIELGSAWRIPTYTEWVNVYNTGGWTNWDGPWNSGLKMHAAGYLNYSNGSLSNRGSNGNYWSNVQFSTNGGWTLDFYSSYSNMYTSYKGYGFSLRCVREN
jgi:hypothetical protein